MDKRTEEESTMGEVKMFFLFLLPPYLTGFQGKVYLMVVFRK